MDEGSEIMNTYRFEDLKVGMEEAFEVQITDEAHRSFEQLSGDINPLHKDGVFAKRRGFEDRVVYGMLASSHYSTLAGVYLPGENCLINECRVMYYKPVYIGDRLKVEGKISDLRESTQRVKIAGKMTNQNGEIVNSAVITVSFTKEQL